MPTTYVQYKRKPIKTTREYDVEGSAPDTNFLEGQGGQERVMTLRPRKLTMTSYEPDDPNTTVVHITLEGRIVRKTDGSLGRSRVACWSAKGWRGYEPPPSWIMEIITAEGLRYGDE